MQEKEHQKKIQRLIIEMNKSGLMHLDKDQIGTAFQYFKKAEKLLDSQRQINDDSLQIKRYQAVTFNNLAIYYKRTNKPKVALTYLKKAIQIQTYFLKDWSSAASTHLNICVIYSFMGKHNEAIEHAQLAIEMSVKQSNKTDNQQNTGQKKKKNSKAQKIKLAAYYNIGVENEHLKRYQQAIQYYKKTLQIAKVTETKPMETKCNQGIARLEQMIKTNKKKILDLLIKKKQSQQRGNYNSMRRNVKNYQKSTENIEKSKITKKYKLYDDEKKPQTQSVEKIPIKITTRTNIQSHGAIPKYNKNKSNRNLESSK